MTKRELIEALLPFVDDMEVVVIDRKPNGWIQEWPIADHHYNWDAGNGPAKLELRIDDRKVRMTR